MSATRTTAALHVDAADLKMLHEYLCTASTGADKHKARVLGGLLREIERHRPVGPDCKHGDRHTPTCGCDDVDVAVPGLVDRLDTAMRSQHDPGEVPTGAVIVYEFVNAAGELRMTWQHDHGITAWKAEGMLRRAARWYAKAGNRHA